MKMSQVSDDKRPLSARLPDGTRCVSEKISLICYLQLFKSNLRKVIFLFHFCGFIYRKKVDESLLHSDKYWLELAGLTNADNRYERLPADNILLI